MKITAENSSKCQVGHVYLETLSADLPLQPRPKVQMNCKYPSTLRKMHVM
jgi:hypothetical protein